MGIYAGSVERTVLNVITAIGDIALVDIDADEAIAIVFGVTAAFIRTDSVNTSSIGIAVIFKSLFYMLNNTFVDIFADGTVSTET